MIGSAAYGPEVLKMLFEVFDNAWADIAPTCGNDPQIVEAARTKLANIILSIASNDPQPDAADLKVRALRIYGHSGGI